MKKSFVTSLILLMAFLLWTVLVYFVDVQPIGPQGSTVGLSDINQAFHRLTGVHWMLYNITDWLGLVPIAVCIGFAVLGMVQWIRRKQISLVDGNLIVLGCFYGITIGVYLFFEFLVINYRPVLIDGILEASYPSSTTVLTICVMSTASIQFHRRIDYVPARNIIIFVLIAFMAFMVIGRLLSGVHWLSDIVGGILLSAGLVMMYHGVSCIFNE